MVRVKEVLWQRFLFQVGALKSAIGWSDIDQVGKFHIYNVEYDNGSMKSYFTPLITHFMPGKLDTKLHFILLNESANLD